MFLSLVILVTNACVNLPTESHAYWHEEWDDYATCEHCGETLEYDDAFCDCGGGAPHCSEEFNSSCWEEYHCNECGQCEADISICDDCGRCFECYTLEGDIEAHCNECGNCGSEICETCSDEMPICVMCCITEKQSHCPWCEGCYEGDGLEKCEYSHDTYGFWMCTECCEAEGSHCPNCGVHVPENPDVHGWCACGGDHCYECSDNAEMYCCNECGAIYCEVNGDDMENICQDCHYCLDCAFENLKHCPECEECGNDPCEDGGQHCVNCCEKCENCDVCLFGDGIEKCDECGLCLECCREAAKEYGCDCGEYCITDSDFEGHFCENCNSCFDEIEQCEYCGLCEECCQGNSDCYEGLCVENPEYEDHFCEYCGRCGHEVDMCDTCIEDGDHRCVECCLEETERAGCEHEICMNSDYWRCHYDSTNHVCYETPNHFFYRVSNGRLISSSFCAKCGASRTATPVITRQPKDMSVPLSTNENRKFVSFSVLAICDDELSYQWYDGNDNALSDSDSTYGSQTPRLTTSTTICLADADSSNYFMSLLIKSRSYYCKITNTVTGESVVSNTVKLSNNHAMDEWRSDNLSTSHSVVYVPQGGGSIKISWSDSNTHSLHCSGGLCSVEPTKTEEHVWSRYTTDDYPAYKNNAGVKVEGYAKRVCLVCGKAEYKEYEYVDPHEHVWSDTYVPISQVYSKTDKYGKEKTYTDTRHHAHPCTVIGCTEYQDVAEHSWTAWETVVAATDHETGTAKHTCTECGFEETKELPIVKHVHTFCDKDYRNNWYSLEDERAYVGKNNRTHYVYCTGEVWDESEGKYVPCRAKGHVEPHHYSFKQLDSGDNYVQLECTCRCGFDRIYTAYDTHNQYSSREAHNLFAEFGDITVYPPAYSEKGKYSGAAWALCYNDGNPYTCMEKGMPIPVLPGSRVVINADDGLRYRTLNDWLISTMPHDKESVMTAISGNNQITIIMPDYDLYVGSGSDTLCDHPDNSTYREYVEGSDIEPTCTKNGKEKDLKCTLCNVILEYGKEIPALGHDFVLDEDTVKTPDCTHKGYEGTQVCSHCGKTQRGSEIPALGHRPAYYDYEYDNYESQLSKLHWINCGDCDQPITQTREAHDFVEMTSNGKDYLVCTDCNYVQDKVLVNNRNEHRCGGVTVRLHYDVDNTAVKENFRLRYYPNTVSDEDILLDMKKAVSTLGTEYTCFYADNSIDSDSYYITTRTSGGKTDRWKQGDLTVLNPPEYVMGKTMKMAITVVGDDEVVPYIEERANPNFVADLYRSHEHSYGEWTEKDNVDSRTCGICGNKQTITRIYGTSRFDTSIASAEQLKTVLGVSKFDSVVVASGTGFADALAGSYLSSVKDAPILLTAGSNAVMQQTADYIKNNLRLGGTIYILGGEGAVPAAFEELVEGKGFTVKRLAGNNRFDTNIEILKEAGVKSGDDILVCTGADFADSLSASAVGKPILLVPGSLTATQKTFLSELGTNTQFYLIGGEGAVSTGIANALTAYGKTERIAGINRFETSVKIAEKFFNNPDKIVMAYSQQFPDGLSAGPLAAKLKAPLILTLTSTKWAPVASAYVSDNNLNITEGYVLGGPTLIDKATAESIVGA